jgi:hypothetical protein
MKTFRQFLYEQKQSEAPRGVIFDGNKVYVGKEHMKPLILSDELIEKIKTIGSKYGYWYEGNGGDVSSTTGFSDKSKYEGSWDHEFEKTVKGYPPEYLYTLFANTKVNNQRENLLRPSMSIFDSIMKAQKKIAYLKDREFDDATLKKFLSMCSEKDVDFIKLSELPATKENVNMFLNKGESLSWPKNWQEYPNKAGKLAKKVDDARNTFLLNRKSGVYFAGSGHLVELLRLDDSLKMIGGEKAED